jgi:recombination protein RecT
LSNAVSTVVADVRSFSESIKSPAMRRQIEDSLPKNVSIDRFTTCTVTAINHSPDLLKADRQSLYNAIVKCAAEGLLPDGNDAILNTYNWNFGTKEKPQWGKKVQYQRMVGGLLKQFTVAGVNAFAASVYANELLPDETGEPRFKFWNDADGQHIVHRPIVFGNRGELVGVYALAKLPNSFTLAEALGLEDINKVRESSPSKDNEKGPWKVWYDRMGQKSALHRLRKRVAIADEAAAARLGAIDNEFEDLDEETGEITPRETTQAPQPADQKRPKALQNVVDAQAQGAEGGGGNAPGPNDVV